MLFIPLDDFRVNQFLCFGYVFRYVSFPSLLYFTLFFLFLYECKIYSQENSFTVNAT